MKLCACCLSAGAACVEVGFMSSIHARFLAMTVASAMVGGCVRALNNNNANNHTRIHGWAGV